MTVSSPRERGPVRDRPWPAWPRASAEARSRLLAVLESGHWWQAGGGVAEELEDRLAGHVGCRAAVCVANGTIALEVALASLGIGRGDEVLVPAMTFISTATAVVRVGARPVAVDVDADTLTMSLESARSRLTSRTRAVIVVHFAGQPVDLVGARELCDTFGLALIEDSAQAFGAERDGRRVGSVGDLSIFSFQAAKLIPAGDGGAILVRDDTRLVEKVERLANCGRRRGSADYDHPFVGTNARISEFGAAVALAHLDEYGELASLRARRATEVREALASVPGAGMLWTAPDVARRDWYMLCLRVPSTLFPPVDNVCFAAALTAQGVPARPIYPIWQQTGAFAGQEQGATPIAERAAAEIVWLHHRLLLDADCGRDIATAIRVAITDDAVPRCQD